MMTLSEGKEGGHFREEKQNVGGMEEGYMGMSHDVQGAMERQVQLEERLESGWGWKASEQKVRASARPGGD